MFFPTIIDMKKMILFFFATFSRAAVPEHHPARRAGRARVGRRPRGPLQRGAGAQADVRGRRGEAHPEGHLVQREQDHIR